MYHYVLELYVSVYDTYVVHVLDPLEKLSHDSQIFLLGPFPLHHVLA